MTGRIYLDWRDRSHWLLPCRHCGGMTNLRDDEHKPSHKTCAEHALANTTDTDPPPTLVA